jgi:hypothetical protein
MEYRGEEAADDTFTLHSGQKAERTQTINNWSNGPKPQNQIRFAYHRSWWEKVTKQSNQTGTTRKQDSSNDCGRPNGFRAKIHGRKEQQTTRSHYIQAKRLKDLKRLIIDQLGRSPKTKIQSLIIAAVGRRSQCSRTIFSLKSEQFRWSALLTSD